MDRHPGDGQPRGFAFIWRRFEIADLPAPMLACVMVTMPANEVIRRTIKSGEADPRMPAILENTATLSHACNPRGAGESSCNIRPL